MSEPKTFVRTSVFTLAPDAIEAELECRGVDDRERYPLVDLAYELHRAVEQAREQARRWTDRIWGDRTGFFHFAFGVGGHFTATGKYGHEHWHERAGRWPGDRDRFLTRSSRPSVTRPCRPCPP